MPTTPNISVTSAAPPIVQRAPAIVAKIENKEQFDAMCEMVIAYARGYVAQNECIKVAARLLHLPTKTHATLRTMCASECASREAPSLLSPDGRRKKIIAVAEELPDVPVNRRRSFIPLPVAKNTLRRQSRIPVRMSVVPVQPITPQCDQFVESSSALREIMNVPQVAFGTQSKRHSLVKPPQSFLNHPINKHLTRLSAIPSSTMQFSRRSVYKVHSKENTPEMDIRRVTSRPMPAYMLEPNHGKR